jgi:hypothetical protein
MLFGIMLILYEFMICQLSCLIFSVSLSIIDGLAHETQSGNHMHCSIVPCIKFNCHCNYSKRSHFYFALDTTMALSSKHELINQGGLHEIRGRRARTHARSNFDSTYNFSLLYTILNISSIVSPLYYAFLPICRKKA